VVSAPEEQWRPLLEAKGEDLLATLFNVSAVRAGAAPAAGIRYESGEIPGLVLAVVPAQALGWRRCGRCWMWSTRVGEDAEHPELCSNRCVPVIRART
jgi:hypothetical protein